MLCINRGKKAKDKIERNDLTILPEKKYGLAGVVSHHSAGFNKARAKMERKIKGKK